MTPINPKAFLYTFVKYNLNSKLTIMTKRLKFICTIILLLAFSSCSSKLERDKAKEIIISKYQFPQLITDQLQFGERMSNTSVQGWGKFELENELVKKNVISFDFVRNERDFLFSYSVYDCQLTLEGEKYKMKEKTSNDGKTFYIVKLAEENFGDITGIVQSDDNKTATVEYTTIINNVTPFGQVMGRNKLQEGKINNHSVSFTKYDDGWRITN